MGRKEVRRGQVVEMKRINRSLGEKVRENGQERGEKGVKRWKVKRINRS